MLSRLVRFAFWTSLLIPAVTSSKTACNDIENEKCEDNVNWNPCSKDFTLLQGQASTATTLWLLGEQHSLQDKTISCIEHLTRNHKEHRIYIEGLSTGKTSCKNAGIKEKAGRECFGWGDTEADKAIGAIFDSGIEVGVNNLQDFYQQEHYSDSAMDDMLKNMIKFKSKEFAEETRAANLLLEKRKSGDSYKKIFSQKNLFLGTKLTPSKAAQLKLYNKKQNQSLLKALDNSPSNLFKVVKTGKAHVVKQEADTGSAEYLTEELKKGKHQNYYAVLAMN
ncbi:MAG: hypothetical protein ABI597_06895 [Gammaproteobacteria bacterium]